MLELDPADIGQHLGDELVRRLYGHVDQVRAGDRARQAFDEAASAPAVLPIRKEAA